MQDPDLTGVILVFFFVFFLPFLVSLLGRILFIFATFMCCCLTVAASVWLDLPAHPIGLLFLFGSWISAWIFSIEGIKTKRAAQLMLAVGKLYSAAACEHRRDATRGKNRALSR
jgi:hypothetical protein